MPASLRIRKMAANKNCNKKKSPWKNRDEELWFVACKGDVESVKKLLADGVPVSEPCRSVVTVLITVVTCGLPYVTM